MSNTPATTSADSSEVLHAEATDTDIVESDLLVEEISIDGMCGVY